MEQVKKKSMEPGSNIELLFLDESEIHLYPHLVRVDFGDTSSLRQAIAEVFDELNSNPESDLTLRFRDPLFKNLFKVA